MVSPSPSTGPGRLRTGRELLLIGAALATALAIVFASRSLLDRYGLDCQDYANLDWQGQPFQTRVERDFSTPLFATRPARFVQSFSTECQGILLIPRSGIYTFALVSRNRSEVLVDDLLLVQTQGVALQRASRAISLEAGQRRVRFRFANARADEPELLMARAGGALRPLNQAYVSRQPLPASAYWLRQPARAAVAMLPFLWIG